MRRNRAGFGVTPWWLQCVGTTTRKAPWRGLLLLVVMSHALLGLGCASYVDRMAPVKAELRRHNTAAALERLDDRFGKSSDDLVYLMERGLLLRLAGRFDESNRVFEHAEQVADDLYTKSVSLSVASLLTSDTVLPYEGEDFERVLINYYQALNYLDLGSLDDALVECRKVQRKLQFYEEQHQGEENKKYRTDPFVHYLMGLIQERAGEVNDAYISFKKAEVGYREDQGIVGVGMPPTLADDLRTAAAELVFTDDEVEILRRYPAARLRPHPPRGTGDVVVLVEVGFIRSKIEASLSIPILESEKDEGVGTLTGKLRDRAYQRRHWTRVHYWLKMALPAYPSLEPPPWSSVEVGGEPADCAEDLDALARASLDDRMPRILLKTIARALAKYLATTKSEDAVAKKHGESAGSAVGALLNLAALATEQADLRAWLGLPREIYMARVQLPAGFQEVPIRLTGRGGGIIAHETVSLEVRDGMTTFATCRLFI